MLIVWIILDVIASFVSLAAWLLSPLLVTIVPVVSIRLEFIRSISSLVVISVISGFFSFSLVSFNNTADLWLYFSKGNVFSFSLLLLASPNLMRFLDIV